MDKKDFSSTDLLRLLTFCLYYKMILTLLFWRSRTNIVIALFFIDILTKAEVLLRTWSLAVFSWSVPVGHDHVTVSQHEQDLIVNSSEWSQWHELCLYSHLCINFLWVIISLRKNSASHLVWIHLSNLLWRRGEMASALLKNATGQTVPILKRWSTTSKWQFYESMFPV